MSLGSNFDSSAAGCSMEISGSQLLEGNLCLKELQTLEGHNDRVWCVAWNPSSNVPPTFASCSGDKTVRIWQMNPSTGLFFCKEVLDEHHTRTVRSCAWSPAGDLLATASFDATTTIWRLVGDEYESVATLEGHDNEVKSAAWNASGSLIATCSRDKSVWIWEVLPGNDFDCAALLQGHAQDVKMVKWHPFVDLLFSCSYDNTIKVWAEDDDGDDWHCVQTLNESSSGHTSTVWALSFNSTGDNMVSSSDDLTIKVWGTEASNGYSTWRHLYTLSGYHNRTIFSVNWAREDVIATGAGDDAICIFAKDKENMVDGSSYKLLLKKDKAHDMDVNAVQWSSGDRRLLASASDDMTIKIWELTYSP